MTGRRTPLDFARGIRNKGLRVKGTKRGKGSSAKGLQLLARNKEERVLGIPPAPWPPTARPEPSAILIVSKDEDAQIAIGVQNRFHGNLQPLALRLARILQTELWADFGWAEVETKLVGASVNLFCG